jgi:GT2 family glycosyltransferase
MREISVIIVSWNARELLRGCLDSIRTTGNSLIQEIIVVDNASTDESPEMVAENFPEVTLIRCKENLGFARGNNLGIARASGSWLALVNSDVVVHPGSFERLVNYIDSHEKVGLVGPAVFGKDGRFQPSCRRLPTIWSAGCRSLALDSFLNPLSERKLSQWMQGGPIEVEVLTGCFWVARREAVAEVGGLDERFFFYAEDLDWCKRFADAGWKVVFVPGATATHFGGSSSAVAPFRYSIEQLRANLTYWRKYRGKLGWGIFYFFSVVHHSIRLLVRSVETALGRGSDSSYKCRRSFVCLRWLFTGKGL